jgi:Fe2+ or Zn2+ uptake regulation protein
MGSCEAAKKCGKTASFNLGIFREATDAFRPGKGFDQQDIKANIHGIRCPSDKSCHDRCKELAPPGSVI